MKNFLFTSDEYYHGPLQDVHKVVEATRQKLEAVVAKGWRETFMVRSCFFVIRDPQV